MGSKAETAISFVPSQPGTLGIEMEWITVDAVSGMQAPLAPAVFAAIGPTPRIKAELFTSTIEINTGIHVQSRSCIDEMAAAYRQVSAILADHGGALLASGTHPFSRWQDQQVTADPRYHRLIDQQRRAAHRFNIFGIHVHIGMPDGDACIRAMNHLMPILPFFLAISVNSPYWHGEDTGLSSYRIKVSENLSQGGMPFYFDDWPDFQHCVRRLIATRSIETVREIWWEMRPHPDFGTLEIRIGDMPATAEDTLAYVAYVRAECLAALATGNEPHRMHSSLIRENRWRACRYGMQARIIDPHSEKPFDLLEWLERRLEYLEAQGSPADDLAAVRARLPAWREGGDGAVRQRRIHAQDASEAAMVECMRDDGWASW
ncbi:MAG TPA: YbdK family carboxylate-amine ligase [Mariprofundaceae bacterium]|nr:YbdK family carboxylate-amine ligase [Mariprofundaceae bacterium]